MRTHADAVKALLAGMTPEEKLAQMTLVNGGDGADDLLIEAPKAGARNQPPTPGRAGHSPLTHCAISTLICVW
jgi:hypothetical protein